jgi:hypothetical protein
MFLKNKRIHKILIYLFLFCLSSCLVYVVYGHVFSNGLSCADDSAIAITAKNLARGYGYATSIPLDGSFQIKSFDPSVTTGPVLVFPAALLVYCFGNLPWVPGFATANICFILLVFIFFIVKRTKNLYLATLFIGILTLNFYILTAKSSFIYWYVLIGELPSALLFISGIIIFSANPNKIFNIIISGIILGMAFMTKMLTLLGLIPLFLYFIHKLIRNTEERKIVFRNIIYGIIAFALPFALFELWKLYMLGLHPYLHNFKEFLSSLIVLHGKPAENIQMNIIEIINIRSKTLNNTFGFGLITLILIGIIVSTLLFRYEKNINVKILFFILLSGAIIHLFWWLFFSKGWPRYAVIGLFLFFSAVSCIVFIEKFRVYTITIYMIMLGLYSIGHPTTIYRATNILGHKFKTETRLNNLSKTVSFLEKHAQDKPFISSWWATYADIEYAMPEVLNIKRFDNLNVKDSNRKLLLVFNTDWVNFYYHPEFEKFKKKFTKVVFSAPPYLVMEKENLNESDIKDIGLKQFKK